MDEEIKFYKTDFKGFLINQSDINLFPKEYLPLLDEVTNLMLKNYSDNFVSLYLGGSIVRKTKAEKRILLVIIVNEPIDLIWLDDFKEYLSKKYNYSKIDFLFEKYSNIKVIKELPFHIKTKWIFISGKNISLEINDYKVDENLLFYREKYKSIINSILFFISNENLKPENIKSFCKTYMAHFILMGFELCMLKEKKYSDDIYTCYKVFLKYYPQYKKYIDEIYSYYKEPTDSKNEVIRIIGNFALWIFTNFDIFDCEKDLEILKNEICLKQ
jgi:hypothetical protein